MSSVEEDRSHVKSRRRFQIGLGTLLYGVLLIALALGWYQDHQRLEDARSKPSRDYPLLEDQNGALFLREAQLRAFNLNDEGKLLGHRFGREKEFLWTTEAYLQRLADLPNPRLLPLVPVAQQFEVTAKRLTDTPDDIYAEALPEMLRFCDSENADVRRGMTIALGQELTDPRRRIEPYRVEVLAKLRELLDDKDISVRSAAARALAASKDEGSTTLDRLQEMAFQENNAEAMLTLFHFDPSAQNREDVVTWIHRQRPNWKVLVANLSEVLPREEAIALLREDYFQTGNRPDQLVMVEAINQLEMETLDDQLTEGSR